MPKGRACGDARKKRSSAQRLYASESPAALKKRPTYGTDSRKKTKVFHHDLYILLAISLEDERLNFFLSAS
jgi:hypothetical protein